jgi:hypothetical protein
MIAAGGGAYSFTGQPAAITYWSPWPLPSDVRLGVVYGMSSEYTGSTTLVFLCRSSPPLTRQSTGPPTGSP